MKRRITELLIPAAAVAAVACGNDGGNQQVCTDLFAYITTIAVDSAGQPVPGPFTVRDSVQRTGAVFTIAGVGLDTPGLVTVFSDTQLDAVRQSGDAVTMTGSGSGKSFGAVFSFGSDGCHVRRIAGPDTVVAH